MIAWIKKLCGFARDDKDLSEEDLLLKKEAEEKAVDLFMKILIDRNTNKEGVFRVGFEVGWYLTRECTIEKLEELAKRVEEQK